MLAHILQNILEPFVNPSLSLHAQMQHISTFCHLVFCKYRINRAAFLPNPLYYDVLSAMKNVVFSAAKQLRLDPSAKFSVLDVGTDPIELLFTLIRMCGGHDNGVNYKQAVVEWSDSLSRGRSRL